MSVVALITTLLAVCGWFIFSYLYISIGEHQIHKRLMHQKSLPESLYQSNPYLLATFEAHGVRHHNVWYREFDYETDPVGREENLEIPLKESTIMLVVALPLWAPIFLVSTLGGCVFVATSLLHNRLWSILHRQMHIPRDVFYKDWALFKFLARNHFMHHQQNHRNFNVVFPFADYLFGTRAQPSPTDIREMMRLGFINPKSAPARRQIAEQRHTVQLQRTQTA